MLRDILQKRLNQAYDLIKQKRYEEARTLLQDVEHPLAKQWLATIDQIAPRKDALSRRNRKLLLWIGIPLVNATIVAIILIIVISNTSNSIARRRELVTLYCMDLSDTTISRSDCSNFTERVFVNEELSAVAGKCTDTHGDNWDMFRVCMQELVDKIELQTDNDIAQVGILYDYCAGASREGILINMTRTMSVLIGRTKLVSYIQGAGLQLSVGELKILGKSGSKNSGTRVSH